MPRIVPLDPGLASYCVAAHGAALRAIGLSPAAVAAIMEDPDRGDFTAKEKALIDLARQANLAPRSIAEERVRALREMGATDAELLEVLGVMELFVGFNRFLDSLRVDIDVRPR